MPQTLSGRIVADAGSISDANNDNGRIAIERAEFKLNWDAANRVLSVPFQILSGGNRFTLIGQIEAPAEASGTWSFKIGGGTVVLTPPARQTSPWSSTALRSAAVTMRRSSRFVVEEGDIGNADVGVAMSGAIDFSSSDLRLAAGRCRHAHAGRCP